MLPLPESLQNDPQALEAFDVHDWLLGALLHLEATRKAAGLTVDELADRLHTTPDWIRRTERDDTGSLSIRRYVAWMVACGMLPDPMTLHPYPEPHQGPFDPTNS